MSNGDALNRQVREFFAKHIQPASSLDDIKGLDALLPDDPAVLRGLGSRCLEEGRKAMHAGHHTEGRRFDILGRQLQQRGEQAEQRKRP